MSSQKKKDSFSFNNDPGKLPEEQDHDFTFTDIPVLGKQSKKGSFSFDDIPGTEEDPALASFENLLGAQPSENGDNSGTGDISAMDATASVINVEKIVKSRGAKKRKRKIAIIATICLLIAVAVTLPIIISKRAEAKAAAEKMQKLSAAEKAKTEREEKKKKIAAILKSAQSTLKDGDAEKAMELFNKVLTIDKNSSSAYTGIARCYETMKDIEKARKNYKKAIKNTPVTSTPYTRLASLLIKDKKIDEATQLLQEGREKSPADPQILITIGDLHYAAGEYEKALEAYNSVKERSSFPENTVKRYSSLLSKNSKQQAKALLIFSGRKFKNADFFISASKLATSPNERVMILVKALKSLPKESKDISEIAFLLAEARIENGDKKAASETLHSIDLSKLDKKYCSKLIALAVKTGMSDIKDYCLKLLKSNPHEVPLQEAILKELEKEQSPEELLAIYSAWLQDNSEDHVANYLYALALGDSLSAAKYFRQALAIKPNFYEALVEVAKIEMNNNQLNYAKMKLIKAIKQRHDAKLPHKLLAIIEIRQGKETEALKNYKEFLDSITMSKAEKIVELLEVSLHMKTPDQADKYLIQLKAIPSMHQKWREYNAEKKLIFGGAGPTDFAGAKTGKMRQYYILYILSKGQYSTLINLRTSKEEFPEFWKIYIMKKKKIATWKKLAELYLQKNIRTGDRAKLLITSMWLKKKTPEEIEKQIKRLPLEKKGITYALIAEEYVNEKKTTKAIIRFKKAMDIPRNIYSDVVKQIYNSLRHQKKK